MRAFAQKQNQPQKAATSNTARTQVSQANDEELGALATETASSRFEHDFSLIPVHHPAPAKVQTKLAISEPGDEYEKEAEHISGQVMRRSEPPLQRACAGEEASAKSEAEYYGRVQTSRVEGGGKEPIAVPPPVQDVLATPGQPLDVAARGFMERRFGHDFSRVRVHTDAKAAESADLMNARAYTVGRDMVFGTGQYAPGLSEGKRLLAHELTHTIQQGQAATTIQRALKFEIQTENFVWAVKSTGAPDPLMLPRKYAPTSVGYSEGAGEERGDRPAYLSVGKKGGPARPAGHVSFVEAEGPLVTEEAKTGVDSAKDAQVIREYQFKTQVKVKDILGKPVTSGQLELVKETDNTLLPAMAGKFNLNTFEFKYLNNDGTQLDVHLNKDREFAKGHVKLMKVGHRKRKDIDDTKAAQHVETWKVTEDPAGPVEFMGKMAKVEMVKSVDNAKDTKMKGRFNPNTWEKQYYSAKDFKGKEPSSSATPLDVHMDEDGRLRPGAVKFMVAKKEPEAKEQTAIELQSEHGGFLEFETPKWFRNWAELEERIQEAVDMTKAMNAQIGTKKEVTDKTTLDAIDKKKSASKLGKIVEWPDAYSTAHLTKLHADKRRLLVQIVKDKWPAKIQASEGIDLSEYGSLIQEHEPDWIKDIVVPSADNLFNTAFKAAKAKKPALDESLFANLKGFLQLVTTYIARGQILDRKGEIAKATFRLMARTNFGSMYNELLSGDEKMLFKSLLGDPKKPSDNPILTELEAPINKERGKKKLAALTLTRKSPFFFNKVGTDPKTETSGPALYDWLVGMTTGKDLLKGTGISDAIGAKTVETKPGHKAYKQALFEVRGTVSHGGATHPASEWVSFAKEIFDAAMQRDADTPDDPTTPGVDESSKTGLKK